ncbi:aromatic ring-opening dioxygenase, catalytic subunit LigB [Bacteriovorax sp. BSW11_IV]|uniref:dioxygenase family protein n=1 Tax=Bacteriovorax sp. BSW11_IV TaxID=1353529 RepID=UPI00038A41BD|nr:class III extradiol ring-cleavage dioxygenase [Bacteriovorax sp. BSW11_IV]EQC44632.1 aromatic ring-opening dioxygenase, catalytic subunit LigB [Bacteriovorax sp. BSW11_IV]
MKSQNVMPVVFLGHGSPLSAFENNIFTQSWQELGKNLETPKGIIILSAHWYTDDLRVTASKDLKTIYDFYGFPDFMYEYDYQGKSDEELIQKVATLTGAKKDYEWGLDHGAWCLLKHMYPKSNVPVVQVSISKNMSIGDYRTLAMNLSKLRKEGVLIIGSGNITHNLRNLDRSNSGIVFDWAINYENKIKAIFDSGDDNVLQELLQSEETKVAHSGIDHLIPALICSFFREDGENYYYFNESIVMGSLSMTSFYLK